MKLTSNILSAVLFVTLSTSVDGRDCVESEVSVDLGYGSVLQKIDISGYSVASINRLESLPGTGNMIVFKSFNFEPIIELDYTASPGVVKVIPGDVCATASPTTAPVTVDSAAVAMLGLSSWFMNSPIALISSLLLGMSTFAAADGHSMTIDIYTDLNEIIHEVFNPEDAGCGPEAFYYEHHPTVFGGYKGCVGEKYLLPCNQDANGASDDRLYSTFPINWDGENCVETGYEFETRSFWILWGDPLDKEELLKRTKLYPTVKLPLERGPYPSYKHGTDETEYMYDDSSSAKAVAKDFLAYLGAIPETEKSDLYVSMTEGAEAGIGVLWAAKALEIAKSTCNRDIYVLMEAPAYGYGNGKIAGWVNEYSGDFYNGTECLCQPNCLDPTVTVNNVGFFPPDIPTRTGGDGIDYPADSKASTSPWFESMVFPENPSGTIKLPRLPSNRRVCDGVYVWPMYFYSHDFVVPLDEKPDCDGWSYSITKGYSASVRAGFITYKKSADDFVSAVVDIASERHTLMDGSYSEWSWMGQMQLQQMIMSRALDDPTSWVGAYGEIMQEKWDVIEEGFKDCPVLELSNYKKGAYAFFVYKEPYLGLQDGNFVSTFFLDVLGVKATTYYWGFRGADPAPFYGGPGVFDFTRMQLYRDVNVYIEVARRAKIVCSDTSAKIGNYLSIDDWKLVHSGTGITRRNLRDELPHLTEKQHRMIEQNHEMRKDMFSKSEACAPEYTTECFFRKIGTRFEDD